MKKPPLFIGIIGLVLMITSCAPKAKTCKLTETFAASGQGTRYIYNGDRMIECRSYEGEGILSTRFEISDGTNGKIHTIKEFDGAANYLVREYHASYTLNNELSSVSVYRDWDHNGYAETLQYSYLMSYNADGMLDVLTYYDSLLVQKYTASYTWEDGNVTSIMYHPGEDEIRYTYDAYPNMYVGTCEFFLVYSPENPYNNKNNNIKTEYYDGGVLNNTFHYTYNYLSDGLPETYQSYTNQYECVEE